MLTPQKLYEMPRDSETVEKTYPMPIQDKAETEMTKNRVQIHLMSNTHCDKEYVFSGPRTRAIVLRTLDELLRLFKEVPEYKYFHLDGQSSPLDTYLSVKPHKRDALIDAVSSGKLMVGPWYTLPDMTQISGESIIRNLLQGHKVAKSFGNVMKVGYNIFGFGQISQLPQIYRGFGIDNITFYRGINEQISPKLEFIWKSPDGSEVLGIRWGEGYRLNFMHFVYLPAVYGRCHWGCPPYDWNNSNGTLMRICDHYTNEPNSFLCKTKEGMDKSVIPAGVAKLLKTFENRATTPYCLASMGWDDGMPYADLPKLLIEVNKCLGDRGEIVQSSLPEYIELLRNTIDRASLDVLSGEMRHENKLTQGGDTRPPLFAGILSARVPINIQNSDVEMRLEKWAEPVSVFAWMFGREYLACAFEEAWKGLFTNHSHDCIGGTHTDAVYNSITERYAQAREIAETETAQSLGHICEMIDTSFVGENESSLIVFNSLPYCRSEIVHAYIDTPANEQYKSFTIEDESGQVILPQVNHAMDMTVNLHQTYDYPIKTTSKRFDFFFEAKQIPAMGYKTFRIRTDKAVRRNTGSHVVDRNTMENEYLRVKINHNGTLDIVDRLSGRLFRELFYFEDRGEVGGPCLSTPTTYDKVINSLGLEAQISLVCDGCDVTTFQIDQILQLPSKAVVDQAVYPFAKHNSYVTPFRRSDETVNFKITTLVSLTKNSKRVDIEVKLHNVAQDHRLRVMIPTPIKTDSIAAEGQFDVTVRTIRREDSSCYFEDIYHTQPHRFFLDVADDDSGLAIITKGTHEYEFIGHEDRTVGITLLRCIRTGPEWRDDPYEAMAQCPGEHSFQFALYPHKGDWHDACVYEQTYRKHVPLRTVQMRKNNGVLPSELSFIKMDCRELVLSTMKLSENGNSIIVRMHNPGEQTVTTALHSVKKLSAARQVSLEELPLCDLAVTGSDTVTFSVEPKKIYTLELFLKK